MKTIIIDKLQGSKEKARFLEFDSISDAKKNNYRCSEKNFLNDFDADFSIIETIYDYENSEKNEAYEQIQVVTLIKISETHRVFINDDSLPFFVSNFYDTSDFLG